MYMTIGEWENTAFMYVGATITGHKKAQNVFKSLDVLRTWNPGVRAGKWIVGGPGRRQNIVGMEAF